MQLSTRAVRSDQFPQKNRCLRGSKTAAHQFVQFSHASNRFFSNSRVATCDQIRRPERVNETMKLRGRSQRERQRPRSREAWPTLNSGRCERERWRRLAALLQDPREIGREKFSCAPTLPLKEPPCGVHRVPGQGPVSVELWRRYQRRRSCSSSVEV